MNLKLLTYWCVITFDFVMVLVMGGASYEGLPVDSEGCTNIQQGMVKLIRIHMKNGDSRIPLSNLSLKLLLFLCFLAFYLAFYLSDCNILLVLWHDRKSKHDA